jgi:hypothetical protein
MQENELMADEPNGHVADKPHDRLRRAREAAKFKNAVDAAREFGWDENTYKNHENGHRGFKRDQAIDYARVFGVSPEWLVFGVGQGLDQASGDGLDQASGSAGIDNRRLDRLEGRINRLEGRLERIEKRLNNLIDALKGLR